MVQETSFLVSPTLIMQALPQPAGYLIQNLKFRSVGQIRTHTYAEERPFERPVSAKQRWKKDRRNFHGCTSRFGGVCKFAFSSRVRQSISISRFRASIASGSDTRAVLIVLSR